MIYTKMSTGEYKMIDLYEHYYGERTIGMKEKPWALRDESRFHLHADWDSTDDKTTLLSGSELAYLEDLYVCEDICNYWDFTELIELLYFHGIVYLNSVLSDNLKERGLIE